MEKRKLRMGMVGGGKGSFIGAIHRMGAVLDGQIDLVCGAFSSDPQRSVKSGQDLYLPDDRIYASFDEMIEKESKLPDTEKMDFISIVTPNFKHYDPAIMALEHGFPVIIDKPLAFTFDEAVSLKQKVEETKLPFAVTYTYTGYPMVKQARAMVKSGEIGRVRKVMVEYPQGWLSEKLEETDSKQAAWRTDPKRAGKSNCFGDIGTHAANMAEYVSGLKITSVLAELKAFGPGRSLDDDANVFLHFEGGVTGVLSASQISAGEENDLKIRIYGEKGGLEWCQRDLNTLIAKFQDKPDMIYRTGGNNAYLHDAALAHTRTPAGHPEGYIEAFANIYRNFAISVRKHRLGQSHLDDVLDYPGVNEGVRGMAMIEAVTASSAGGSVWTDVPTV